ncbi:MAG TPA: YceI family protein [Rheinheimera sp.]|uniref:YceI family protein n=1 Tax=Rheinheimera sp. TaxID=1869214 RepID=UPI002F933717
MKVLALSFALCAGVANAATWQLDNEQSSLHFVSVKNELVAETHAFQALNGSWDEKSVSVSIPVSSMQTNIPIRNDRIWQYVLQADQFANIQIKAPLTSESIASLTAGNSLVQDLPLTATIAGQSAVVTAKVRITMLNGSTLQAVTEAPLMLDTNQFKLGAGIAKLQELAGLKRIDPMVPVTFNVRFSKQ